MLAYEFNSVVNNDAILIPDKYRGLIHSNMRVIVLSEEKEGGKRPVAFSAPRLCGKNAAAHKASDFFALHKLKSFRALISLIDQRHTNTYVIL